MVCFWPEEPERPLGQCGLEVNGWRGDTSITKRVEYELYYLRNWSFTLDLQIITLTFLRLFDSKNAY